MKRLIITAIITSMCFFFTMNVDAISVIKLGKGGVVIQPNGSYKLCPQFSFRKCCKVTIQWKDIWNWITGDGCWEDDVNVNMPLCGTAEVFDDDGGHIGFYNVQITWINPNSCAAISGNEITFEHPDIKLEATP